jgi:hypothetical protein
MRAQWPVALFAALFIAACAAPQEEDGSVDEAQAPQPTTQGETPIPEDDDDSGRAIATDNPGDEEERQRLEQAIGARGPTVPATDELSLDDVQQWCSEELRQDRGQTVGDDAAGKPCAKHVSHGPGEARLYSEYYAYDEQGRISHSWTCGDDDGCSVTAFVYGEIASGETLLVQQKACDRDGSASFKDMSYELAESRDEATGPYLVQSVDMHHQGAGSPYQYRLVFDQRGQLVREERFVPEEEDYRTARERETTYGEQGEVLKVLHLSEGNPRFVDVYSYDNEGRLARIDAYSAERFEGGEFPEELGEYSPDASLVRTYDEQGRLATKTEQVQSELGAQRSLITGGYHEYSYDCFEQ